MTTAVAISHAALALALPRPPGGGAGALARELMAALEEALDARLPPLPELVVLPALRLEVSCREDEASGWIAEVAARLADRIALALPEAEVARAPIAPTASAGEPALPEALVWSDSVASWLAQAARAVRSGAPAPALGPGGRAAMPQAAEPVPPPLAPTSSGEERRTWLLRLGALARAGQLASAAARLDPHQAASSIGALAEQLGALAPADASTGELARARARLARAVARVRTAIARAEGARPEVAPCAAPEVVRLLVVAELARLAPRGLLDDAPLCHVVAGWLRVQAGAALAPDPGRLARAPGEVPDGAAPGGAPAPPAEGTTRDARPDPTSGGRDGVHRVASDLSPRAMPWAPDALVAEPSAPGRDLGGGGLAWLWSAAAGLSLLLRPLEELGFSAALRAVRPASVMAPYWLLRRLVLGRAPTRALDPAVWWLAGLASAPEDEDRRTDLLGWQPAEASALARAVGVSASEPLAAFDAWARAAAEEFVHRFETREDGEAALCALLRHAGTLLDLGDALEVQMLFPEHYEALLRAGLLRDAEDLPWLEGRPLRFTFTN